MSRAYTARFAEWRSRWPVIAIGLLAVIVLAIAAWRFLPGLGQPGEDPNAITLQYTTEQGEGETEGVVNSPMRIAVRMPWSTGSQKGTVSLVTLQLLDEAGNPAQFGDKPPEPILYLRPTIDIMTWEYVGSVPSNPGTYRAHLHIETPYDSERPQDYDFTEPHLVARADTGPNLTSGYVFNFESNLWIMSTDAKSQRRLTYYQPINENADTPSWSPDGALIAYAYTPPQPPDQIPGSDIWVIKPDRTGARQIAAHASGESLLYPAWSADGKYLYFTIKEANESAMPIGMPASPGDNRRIDRIDISTGERTTWATSAHMASAGGPDGDIVYLELTPAGPDTDPSTVPQKLMRARPDGSNKKQLVGDKVYGLMYAPQMSPDGKWVVYSAVNPPTQTIQPTLPVPPTFQRSNVPTFQRSTDFDLFDWLGVSPKTASAHVVPWDLYLVPAEGGAPQRVTYLEEDQPYPIWLDNSTLAFMCVSGLYNISIGGDGKATAQPTKIHAGSLHGGLTWRAP